MERSPANYVGGRILVIGMAAGAALMASVIFALLGMRWWPFLLAEAVGFFAVYSLADHGRILDPGTWLKGHDAQFQVTSTLRQLEACGYRVIDGVDLGLGKGDADHVVVGPTGLFAIETKSWPGRVSLDVSSPKALPRHVDAARRQAIRQAIDIRDLVGARWCEAALVLPNANVVNEPVALPQVTVLSAARLNAWITDRPHALTEDAIAAIVRALNGA